jgi:DNA-binding NarL/FixJ family response regulator
MSYDNFQGGYRSEAAHMRTGSTGPARPTPEHKSHDSKSPEPRTQILAVVEPRGLVRECLVNCLRSTDVAAEVVPLASVAALEAWHEQLDGAASEVLVLLSGGGVSRGMEALEREMSLVSRLAQRMPVVIVSETEDPDYIVEMMNAGARGVIPASGSLGIAVEALRLVRAGGQYVPASSLLASRRAGAAASVTKGPYSGMFTSRQAAVVQAICRGKANKVIAYELQMKESTVKVHVRNIMRKLQAQNRTQVAMLAESLRTYDRPSV